MIIWINQHSSIHKLMESIQYCNLLTINEFNYIVPKFKDLELFFYFLQDYIFVLFKLFQFKKVQFNFQIYIQMIKNYLNHHIYFIIRAFVFQLILFYNYLIINSNFIYFVYHFSNFLEKFKKYFAIHFHFINYSNYLIFSINFFLKFPM